jgi:hypothetical protein
MFRFSPGRVDIHCVGAGTIGCTHAIAHVLHHVEIVGDEQVREGALGLELLQHVQHLGQHRFVEGGDRLVEDQGPRAAIGRTPKVTAMAASAGASRL